MYCHIPFVVLSLNVYMHISSYILANGNKVYVEQHVLATLCVYYYWEQYTAHEWKQYHAKWSILKCIFVHWMLPLLCMYVNVPGFLKQGIWTLSHCRNWAQALSQNHSYTSVHIHIDVPESIEWQGQEYSFGFQVIGQTNQSPLWWSTTCVCSQMYCMQYYWTLKIYLNSHTLHLLPKTVWQHIYKLTISTSFHACPDLPTLYT